MARIYEQDKAYFEKQDNESIAAEIRLTKSIILEISFFTPFVLILSSLSNN
jgi:hypothetical protein